MIEISSKALYCAHSVKLPLGEQIEKLLHSRADMERTGAGARSDAPLPSACNRGSFW
jgi:hypothetical protein